MLDNFERVGNAAGPKGVPNLINLAAQFTGKHGASSSRKRIEIASAQFPNFTPHSPCFLFSEFFCVFRGPNSGVNAVPSPPARSAEQRLQDYDGEQRPHDDTGHLRRHGDAHRAVHGAGMRREFQRDQQGEEG